MRSDTVLWFQPTCQCLLPMKPLPKMPLQSQCCHHERPGVRIHHLTGSSSLVGLRRENSYLSRSHSASHEPKPPALAAVLDTSQAHLHLPQLLHFPCTPHSFCGNKSLDFCLEPLPAGCSSPSTALGEVKDLPNPSLN